MRQNVEAFRSFLLDARRAWSERWRMKTLLLAFSALAAVGLTSSAFAQANSGKRVSPHDNVAATIDGDQITVSYGRPCTKDPKTGQPRKVWGTLVPFDKVWRLGADEATQLTTQKALAIGGKEVPAGTYSLFMLPRENGAELIVNKQTGQWGTKYDQSQDLVRVPMKKENVLTPVDQLTMAIDNTANGGTLRVSWEGVQYSVDLRPKA
jgi:hypothetical protein